MKKIIFVLFIFNFYCSFLSAELTRGKKEKLSNETKGTVNTFGLVKNGVYFSPEKTFFFQIPPLKENYLIEDKQLGKFREELYVAFINPDKQRYQIDVYYYHKLKTAEDFFKFQYKKNMKKHKFLFKGYINEKFTLFKRDEQFDVYIIIERSTQKDFSNVIMSMAYILVKDRVYSVMSALNYDSEFSITEKKNIFTDDELIIKGKESMVDMLSRFYVYLPEDREKIMAEFKSEQKGKRELSTEKK